MGRRLAASALVEQDDTVGLRVEEAAVDGAGGGARAAVDEDRGLAVGLARFLEVDLVEAGIEVFRAVRFDLRVEGTPPVPHRAHSAAAARASSNAWP